MIQLHDVAAVVVICGGLAALTSRDARSVAVGMLVAMVVAPLASSPAPSTLAMTVRTVGALLATYLLWTSARRRSVSSVGSGSGLLAAGALAAAAFCVGWWASPVAPLHGSLAAQAAGISLVAMAVVPLTGRDPLRGGTAVVTLIVAFSLLLDAWAGLGSPLQQLVWTGLLVGATGATSLLLSPVAESADEVPMAIPAAVPVLEAADEPEPYTADEPEPYAAVEPAPQALKPPEPYASKAPDPHPAGALRPTGVRKEAQRVMGARDGRLRPRDDR